jgi:hypothetical protein
MDQVDVTKPLLALSCGLDGAFSTPGAKQDQLAAALIVVARFLQAVISLEHAATFDELSSAIADLTTGAVHPWLMPARDAARRDPSQLWRGRASAVVALEALYAAGTSPLETAARKLIRNYPKIKLLGGGKLKKQADFSTLLQWRKEFSSGRVKDDDAKELFSAGRELIQKFSRDREKLRAIVADRARAAARAAGVFAPTSNTP